MSRIDSVVGRLVPFLCAVLVASPAAATAQGKTHGMGMEWGRESFLLFDQLELVPAEEGLPVVFEAVGWYGGAFNRLWVRSEGHQRTDARTGSGELEVFYGRLVSPYWDALIGLRFDGRWGDVGANRTLLAASLQGLAPLRFELAPSIFLSERGDFSARLDASYQFLLTQKLVAEPSLDVNVAIGSVPEFGVGSGFNDVVLGTRLRYEIRREIAPYVGLVWTQTLGATAAHSRRAGESVSRIDLVGGLRIWR